MRNTAKVRTFSGKKEQWEIDEIAAEIEVYRRSLTEAATEWMAAFEKRQEAVLAEMAEGRFRGNA